MQTNHVSDLSSSRPVEGQADVRDRKSAPMELSLSDLRHVSAGMAPNGTWTTDSMVEAPNGTW